MKKKLECGSYFAIGACFLVIAWINQEVVFFPIGCCFLALGSSKTKKDK
jgi:hypothetical protein